MKEGEAGNQVPQESRGDGRQAAEQTEADRRDRGP